MIKLKIDIIYLFPHMQDIRQMVLFLSQFEYLTPMGQQQCCEDKELNTSQIQYPNQQLNPMASKTSRFIVICLLSPIVRYKMTQMKPYNSSRLQSIPIGVQSEAFNEVKVPPGYYHGQWLNQKCHGKGQFFYKDGSYYQGTFKNGMAEGEGRLIFNNGSIYEGQIKGNEASGSGKYWDTSHEYQYQGQWENDKPHGCGHQMFGNGCSYQGGFVKGVKEGYGHYVSNQGIYQGYFIRNLFDGQGSFEFPDKRRYQGEWKQGQMSGQGIFIWPDGNRYEGGYKSGLKHGKGTFYFGNGNIFRGTWRKGLKHGEGQLKIGNEIIGGVWNMGELQNIQVHQQT